MFTDPEPGPGPWFTAEYGGTCSLGGEEIEPGEEIRADGHGEYECRACVEYHGDE